MIVTSPETCPDCGTDLARLTPPARCPACGFEFDQHTRVWRFGRSWHHHAVLYGLLGLAVGLLVAISYRLRFGEVPNPLLPILAALAAAVLGLLIDRVLSGRVSNRFVAITPPGILVGTRRRSQLIPWDDVGRVRIHGRVPRIERHSSGVAVPLEDVFESPDELLAFREAVNDARQRYSPKT